MPKDSLRDKLDGNKLDMSLSNVSVVPVKEMLAFPKGTHVDLSCNVLTTLPVDFCNLTYIVKLDLSKNQIQSLPANIGDLQKLQHLDLFGNQLTTLPVSFFRLKSLKWLDVRSNPLDENISKVAGNCLNEAECKQCASNIVSHMRSVQADMERKKQKQLQQEREVEAMKKAKEEEERLQKKNQKLAEKELRRAEYKAKQAESEAKTTVAEPADTESVPNTGPVSNGVTVQVEKKQKDGLSCCGILFTSVLGLLMVIAIAYYYCETHPADHVCRDTRTILMPYWTSATEIFDKYSRKT